MDLLKKFKYLKYLKRQILYIKKLKREKYFNGCNFSFPSAATVNPKSFHDRFSERRDAERNFVRTFFDFGY